MKLAFYRAIAYAIDICSLFIVLAPAGFLAQRLFGTSPQTGRQIWTTIFFNFSIPSWLYFILSDRSSGGATVGKRVMGIRTTARSGNVSLAQAIGRTAIKLLPWELTHVSMFALSNRLGKFSPTQVLMLTVTYILMGVYIAVVVRSRGTRSVHDLMVGSSVRWSRCRREPSIADRSLPRRSEAIRRCSGSVIHAPR